MNGYVCVCWDQTQGNTQALCISSHVTEGFCCFDKTLGPKVYWRGKGLFQLNTLRSHFITEGNEGRNLRQKLNQKSGQSAAYCLLLMSCSVYFFIAPRITSPGVSWPVVGLPSQSLIKTMCCGLCL